MTGRRQPKAPGGSGRGNAEAARGDGSTVEELRRALWASEERYRALVESHAEMLCRFRPDGTILFVNRSYAEALNTTPEALTGKNFWEFVSDADRQDVRAMLGSLTPESPERRIENRIQLARGERWVLWTNRGIIFDDDGRLVEAQSAGVDITDRKRMEVALYESDRRKDEFLATLAHELRNPLAPIGNSLEILKRADTDTELLQLARESIERQVAHLVRLVDDLLDVSRITRDKLELRKSRVDLCALVTEAVENCRAITGSDKRQIALSLPDESLWLEADAVRLAQVLNNLLNNACKYTGDGGTIAIEVKRNGAEAIISVRDSGIGMPPDKLESIFEMFSQVKAPASAGGLGIGLTLVKRLVELHGGSVSAQSPGLGKGSEFLIRLPISAEDHDRADAAGPGAGEPVPPRRILIVDDNVDNAETLAALLRLGGHETKTAYDGAEGVDLAEVFQPDVVLLDLGLPSLSGIEACRRIRSRPWGRKMLIAALTGWGQERDRQESRAAGFDEHLVKPVELASIMRLLAALDREGPARPRAQPVV